MAIWYVRKTGSDTNSGTSPSDAFLTIGKAQTAAVTGDTIDVGEGEWVEDITKSGLIWQGASSLTTIIKSNQILNKTVTIYDMRLVPQSGGLARITQSGFPIDLKRCIIDCSEISASSFLIIWDGSVIHADCSFINCIFENTPATSPFRYLQSITNFAHTIVIYNCVFYNNQKTPMEFVNSNQQTGNIIIKNCIFHSLSPLKGTKRLIGNTENIVIDRKNNCYFNCDASLTQADLDPSEFIADPLFYDPANENFFLKPDSPCIAAGVAV